VVKGVLFMQPGPRNLKVKTFTGTDTAEVDQRVNDWLAKSKVRVWRTMTAFKGQKFVGRDVVGGKILNRRGLGIAISVWYDEPYDKAARPPTRSRRAAKRATS
jgi:hypothetical protein